MKELKPRFITTNSNRSRINIRKYFTIILIFSIGFYFGYSYKGIDIDTANFNSDISKSTTSKNNELSFSNTSKSKNNIPESTISKKFAINKLSTDQNNNKLSKNISGSDKLAKKKLQHKIELQETLKTISDDLDKNFDKFTLQIAAFETDIRSRKVAEELNNKGFRAYSITVINSKGDKWHLVKLGEFNSFEDAQNFSELLMESEGINSQIEVLENPSISKNINYQ